MVTSAQRAAVQANEHGPFVGSVVETRSSGRTIQRALDDALDAEGSRVVSAFAAAERGETSYLIDLEKSCRRYDSRLDTVSRSRTLALTGRPWAIKPLAGYERDKEAIEIARKVARIFSEVRGFAKLRSHLAHAPLEGFQVLEHEWRTNTRGEWVSQPKWKHGNRFAWDISRNDPTLCHYERGGARYSVVLDGVTYSSDSFPGVPLREAFPGKFVIHVPSGGASDYPWLGGALRPRIMASLAKRAGLRWWLGVLERWGQPQVAAFIDRNEWKDKDSTSVDRILKMLRDLSPNWRAVLPKGVDLKEIPVSVIDGLHEKFVAHQNTEDAIAILGQNLTTEVKEGSFAAAKVANIMRLDLLSADIVEQDETITDDWIWWLVRYNWPGAPVPELVTSLSPSEAITLAEWQAGLYSADEYHLSHGRSEEPEGKGRRFAPSAAPAVALPVSTGPVPKTDAQSPEAAPMSDAALNGAQVASLQAIMEQVGAGLLAGETAILMVTSAFPTIPEERARRMVEAQASMPRPTIEGTTPTAGGAGAASPFGSRTSTRQTTAPDGSRMNLRSQNPLATSLRAR